jgi:hypothetical protein
VKKTPDQVTRQIANRLNDTWVDVVLHETRPDTTLQQATATSDEEHPVTDLTGWPHDFPLGRAPSADIASNIGAHVRALHEWRTWADTHDVHLEEASRHIAGSPLVAAKHVTIDDIDKAASVVGAPWPELLTVARTRAAHLQATFPGADLRKVLRAITRLRDVNFDILCRTAAWFRDTPPDERAGLTPRQVPLEGVHAKWLDKHEALVRALAALDDLELLPPHPARIHFTYLDPHHLDNGGRQHDSYSVGDNFHLPYQPDVVLISENKDTAVGFHRMPGGIAVEGAGTGGGTIASTPWIREAPLVIYWGDMDADGLEILNEFRERGVNATSMFMDLPTYQRYQRYGTNDDRNDNPLNIHTRLDVVELHAPERELYNHLTSGTAPVLRVEQERIPLTRAVQEAERLRAILREDRGPRSPTPVQVSDDHRSNAARPPEAQPNRRQPA